MLLLLRERGLSHPLISNLYDRCSRLLAGNPSREA
jgi:hypothetical protein